MDEYKMLREELVDNLKMQERLTQFCYTVVLAIWTAAFTIQSEWVLLFSLLIIVSVSEKVLKSKIDSAYLAAYMHVYLEPKIPDIQWETNNAKYCKTHFRDKELNHFHLFVKLDFVFLSFITILMFWLLRGKNWILFESYIITALVALIQLIVLVFEGIVVKKFYKYGTYRATYIQRWQEVFKSNYEE